MSAPDTQPQGGTRTLAQQIRDCADTLTTAAFLDRRHVVAATLRDLADRAAETELRADRAENARDQVGEMLHTAQEQLNQAHTLRVMPRSLEPLIDKERHSPAKFRAWLAAHGWTLFQQYDECSEWTSNVKRPGWLGEGGIVMVLDSTRFSDYAHHLAAMVTDLAGLHGTGELAVLAGIEVQSVQDATESNADGRTAALTGTPPAREGAPGPQEPGEPVVHAEEIPAVGPNRGQGTGHALCDTGDGTFDGGPITQTGWRVTCVKCLAWPDEPDGEQ